MAAGVATLLEQIRDASRVLAELAGPASAVGPELVRAIESARADVERRLADGGDLLVALGAETTATRRGFLNALLGARAFDPGAPENPTTIVTVRSGAAIEYVARLRDGTAIEFAVRMADRADSFAKARARAERELAEAQTAERETRARVERAQREADERTARLRRTAPSSPRAGGVRTLWEWLVRVVLALVGRAPVGRPALPAPSVEEAEASDATTTQADWERWTEEARTRTQQAAARMERVGAERTRYEQERAESYVRDLRELTDGSGRGADVDALSISFPTALLPPGIVLVATAEPSEDAEGCIALAGEGPPSPELSARLARALMPAKPHAVRTPSDLPAVLEQVQRARPVVAAVRAAAALRRCIALVSDEGARAEAVCNKRIAALEGQRIPQPAEFRARQMIRMRKAIDDAAGEVEQGTLRRWRADVGRTKEDWRAGVEACADRKAVEAFVRTINQSAPAHLQALVDDAGHQAIAELQRASETLQEWFLQEIHERYRVTRRIEDGDAPTAVVGDALEIAPLGRAPLQSTLDRFEKDRVGLGLGGAAAGAAVGTIIVPGIGTAIGAFLGVFAGFLKGVDSLKKECAARLDACLDDVERSVSAQIAGREASLAEALRASLDEAFDKALERLEESIERLMALERRVLESERRKLEELAGMRRILEDLAAQSAGGDAG
jgi:hypothetical protein